MSEPSTVRVLHRPSSMRLAATALAEPIANPPGSRGSCLSRNCVLVPAALRLLFRSHFFACGSTLERLLFRRLSARPAASFRLRVETRTIPPKSSTRCAEGALCALENMHRGARARPAARCKPTRAPHHPMLSIDMQMPSRSRDDSDEVGRAAFSGPVLWTLHVSLSRARVRTTQARAPRHDELEMIARACRSVRPVLCRPASCSPQHNCP